MCMRKMEGGKSKRDRMSVIEKISERRKKKLRTQNK